MNLSPELVAEIVSATTIAVGISGGVWIRSGLGVDCSTLPGRDCSATGIDAYLACADVHYRWFDGIFPLHRAGHGYVVCVG